MPAIMCQIPHHAAINAIAPFPLKKANTNIKPSPELWIPVSIEILLQCDAGNLNNFGNT